MTDKYPQKTKWFIRILISILLLLAVSAAAFVIWANDTNPVMDEALAALQPSNIITVTQNPWITFRQNSSVHDTGIIFYPGGKVDARAYAPLMRSLATEGYLTVIVPMPLNLAFTGINKANDVIAAYPEIDHWYLAGHSLGGAMAANYIYNQPYKMDGLILYASYPAESNSLAHFDIPVLSIYGTEDYSIDRLEASPIILPGDAIVHVIEGGNHAQFGYYGIQARDGTAAITREDQQEEILQTTLEWLGTK